MYRKQVLLEKLREAAASVLPISLIVLAICFVLVPVDTGLMLSFVLATAMLILGMGLFTLGAEMSMSKIGNYMGAKLTKSRKLGLILIVSFLLGVAITVAEPDLQVLAANVPEIDKTVLILTVSVGVGIFLMLCMVRILFGISLRLLLIVFYVLVFLAAFLSDQGILDHLVLFIGLHDPINRNVFLKIIDHDLCAGDDALRHHGSAARCVCGADAANPSGDWLGRGPDYRGGAAFRLSDAARTFAGRSRYRREKPLLAQGGAGDSGSRSACHWRRTVAAGKFQPGRTGMVAVPGCRLSACRASDASVLSEAAHGAAARVRGRAFKSAV